ncbi:MAG: hypothetical protein R6X16_04235 [Anaerolineae bacterium]
MDTRRRVLLYGDSLVLAGLQASLAGCADVEVVTLQSPASGEALLGSGASVVLYDQTAARPEALLAEMQAVPGLLIIGVDVSSDQMRVVSSHSAPAQGVDGLVRVIERAGRA